MDSVGKIHHLYCENFVTYDNVTVYPGKHLNIIIGPNGSGKSTLVAAIILGMGGEPKLLSRAYEMKEYVKNGKEKALIRIAIYVDNDENTIAFQRSFSRTGKSIYGIDNKIVSHTQYMKEIAKFNIQINNLCQFMPQDRVQDFAKMNSQELLNSTQEAIATTEMIEHFKKLKELRHNQKNGNKVLIDNQKMMKELEDRNAQIQSVIEKIQIRQKFLDDLQIGEKKRICLELNELREDLEKVNKLIQSAQNEFNEAEKELQQVSTSSKDVKTVREEMSTNLKKLEAQISQLLRDLDQLDDTLLESENSIHSEEQNLKNNRSALAERENELRQASRLYEAFVKDLKLAMENCGPEFQKQFEANAKAIDETKRQILQLNEQRSDLNGKIDNYHAEITTFRNRINKIQNESERRLAKLRDINHDAYRGVQWLRRNQHIFAGHVYEPLLLELRIKDAKNALYVENTIPIRDLLSFVCTTKSDVSLLIQKMCQENNLKINVLHSDPADSCSYESGNQISYELRRFGFYSNLLDMVDAPPPILNYLCAAYQIHKILVATNEVEKYVDQLPRDLRIFYSERNRYRIVISNYTQESSTTLERISEQNLLSAKIDSHQLNDINEQINNITREIDELKQKRTCIETKIHECEENVNEKDKVKKRLEMKKLQISEKKQALKFQQERLMKLRNMNIDITQLEAKFKELCGEMIKIAIKTQQRKSKLLDDYQNALEKKQFISMELQTYRKETIDIENKLKATQEDYEYKKKRLQSLKSKENQIKTIYSEKENQALIACDGKLPYDRKFKYKEQFKKFPDSLRELEEKLIEIKTRAECLNEYQVDLVAFENRAKEISQLEKAINRAKNEQDNLQSQIKEHHDSWFPYFEEKINTINSNFSRFMASLDYVGEVKIQYSDPSDYDSYGINILVQYRNNSKLHSLDRFIQSGGERAVAIALYSMSLQQLTHVPFRCVDEINQGMDTGNERKVFNLIVDQTCRSGSSQYFFITPKLIPNLRSNEYLTALIVFNGELSPNVFTKITPSSK